MRVISEKIIEKSRILKSIEKRKTRENQDTYYIVSDINYLGKHGIHKNIMTLLVIRFDGVKHHLVNLESIGVKKENEIKDKLKEYKDKFEPEIFIINDRALGIFQKDTLKELNYPLYNLNHIKRYSPQNEQEVLSRIISDMANKKLLIPCKEISNEFDKLAKELENINITSRNNLFQVELNSDDNFGRVSSLFSYYIYLINK